jgi:voltage-gated sodium channel
MSDTKQNTLSDYLRPWIESDTFRNIITGLIIINAFILGLETYPKVMADFGVPLIIADQTIVGLFIVELTLRILVYKRAFFRDPWSVFDMIVVSMAFIPRNVDLAVFRAARAFRLLRLISIFPHLRSVVESLLRAIPGIASILAILGIFLYVFAVMGTQRYGTEFPEWFGTLPGSFFSLFQIMTLEGWSEIVRTIVKTHPYAAIFFIFYILVTSYSILNLFIAVMVDSMSKKYKKVEKAEQNDLEQIKLELASLHQKIDDLKK